MDPSRRQLLGPGKFLLFSNRALACLSRVYFKILRVYRVGTASIALDTVDNTVFESRIAV